MNSIDDITIPQRSLKEKVKETLQNIVGATIIIALGGLCYQTCFGSRTIENTTITGKDIFEVTDYDTNYSETQNTIDIDKHKRCIRGPYPFGSSFDVGDKLKEIKYRPGLGPCDYYVSHKR
ncbi:hypothetical protein HOC35_01115 [Candidatus Woesearchaeota archaeon]|jgi:hypothetical protein|nr:hypothetical protein [Candidatus Woesearchaeota archaeon]